MTRSSRSNAHLKAHNLLSLDRSIWPWDWKSFGYRPTLFFTLLTAWSPLLTLFLTKQDCNVQCKGKESNEGLHLHADPHRSLTNCCFVSLLKPFLEPSAPYDLLRSLYLLAPGIVRIVRPLLCPENIAYDSTFQETKWWSKQFQQWWQSSDQRGGWNQYSSR